MAFASEKDRVEKPRFMDNKRRAARYQLASGSTISRYFLGARVLGLGATSGGNRKDMLKILMNTGAYDYESDSGNSIGLKDDVRTKERKKKRREGKEK
jgi:hypothetical protein